MENKKIVYLLWTGGWDSTFRLLQLAEMDIIVKPVYVIDPERKSREYEMKAMNEILDIVRSEDRFIAVIEDIEIYDAAWILDNCKNEEISESYRYMRDKYALGSQYEWLSLLCNYLDIDMECVILWHDKNKRVGTVLAEGNIEPIPNDIIEGRKHIVPKGENRIAYNVFGRLIICMFISKTEEERIANEKSWIDIMKKTWFCHTPIKGKPCGVCNPCHDALIMGMEWRMPGNAIKRHKYRKLIMFFREVKAIIKRFIIR